MNLDPIKQVGIRAAYQAGEILKNHFGHLTRVNKKGAIDLVTIADIESEQAILEAIRSRFPDHAILAEESGDLDGDPQMRWIVDPLDGTTNFAHNLGVFSISIAFAYNDEIMMGLVFNPINGELFSAFKGQGAQLNNQQIRVSTQHSVKDSLLATGFPYDIDTRPPGLITRFSNCLASAQGIRRLGSAALDLCYVACGRFDGFWEENLNPWDTAAGALIVEEAGGQVSDFDRTPFRMDQKQILSTNGQIHTEMISLLEIEDDK